MSGYAMNDRGFLVDVAGGRPPCTGCGTTLEGESMGRPAESYLGTYTGLCYPCERGPAVRVAVLEDGAEVWSHPPHAPSWRRDRETKWWYPDCANPKCEHGRVWVSQPYAQGGPYTLQCDACMKRLHAYPPRARQMVATKRMDERWLAFLTRTEKRARKLLGLKARDPFPATVLDDPRVKKIADYAVAWRERYQRRIEARFAGRRLWS